MAVLATGGRIHRRDPTQRRERGLVGKALGVVARGDQQRTGDIDADSAKRDQVGRHLLHERLELRLEVIHLPVEVSPARGEAAQYPLSGRDRVGRQDVAQLPRMVRRVTSERSRRLVRTGSGAEETTA